MRTSWLESETMLTLFSCSAWVVVGWGILIVFGLILWGDQTKSFQPDNLIAMVFGCAIMVVTVAALLIIMLGMMIHCLSSKDLSAGSKTLWSIFAFLTAPFGAAIYFFAVYKKQAKIHREVTNG